MSYNLVDRIAEELAPEAHLSEEHIKSVLNILSKLGALNSSIHDATEFFLVDEPDGITKMSFEQYLALPIEQRHSLALELQKRNWHAIQPELQKQNAQWMLVCGGSVLKFSASWEELPTDEEIQEIGYQQNKVPMVFVQNPLIEETAWSPLPNDDWYPTIPVYFGRAQWDDEQLVQHGLFMIGDFDTGAPFILANHDTLIQERILDLELVRNPFLGSHLGRAYAFFISELRIGVADEDGNVKSAPVQCRCVMNWAGSPICHVNPQRQALVGRNIILTLALQLNLNGAKKSTCLPAID